jgi:hypothetical protein
MKNTRTLDRRRFLQESTALAGLAGAGLLAAPSILSARSVNDKLGIAVIGCGGQGSGNPGLAAGERLVALVDVDEKALGKAIKNVKAKVKEPTVFHDYRRMFDRCGKDIDAVLIATPDHHHAPAAIRAIERGKHVFVEKPMTWCLYEARKLTESARKYKVATQMGNQGHSGEGYRLLCEYIWAGAIGNVTETHSLMSRNFGGSGMYPQNNHLCWHIPARGAMPAVTVHSYDNEWPAFVKDLQKKYSLKLGGGTVYVGDKGILVTGTYGDDPRILPRKRHEEVGKPPRKLARSRHGVKGDFLDACKGGEPASASFDYSGPFTEFVLTGVLASRAGAGKTIAWDVEQLRCTNLPEVNAWIKRAYRAGWEV